MSARFVPVGWNRAKYVYDAVLLAAVCVYLLLYLWVGPSLATGAKPVDDQTLAMKAWGSCAFVMLSVILAIGPLCRLDSRFLPLLYNRRHFGVITCVVAAGHASAVLGWYFAYSATPSLVALLGADADFSRFSGFPFIPFGIAAFLILCALAATSHDFWLAFLGPPLWKALHMAIYVAYALAVAHVGLGALQSTRDPLLATIVMASVVALAGLHVAAARREHRRDAAIAVVHAADWVVAGEIAAIAEGEGIVVHLADAEPVAIFRHEGRLSAVSNLCAHQNGPLGEGRVVGGCITCPWHGFQYRLDDGCAPPPFTEKLATYNLRLDGSRVLLDRKANPPGTLVPPLVIAEVRS